MQRTLSLAAAKSPSSTSPLSLRPLMAKVCVSTSGDAYRFKVLFFMAKSLYFSENSSPELMEIVAITCFCLLQLQCRTIQSFPASSSSSVVRIDKVVRNVCQLQFKRENASCFTLACALPSISSVSYAAHWSSLTSFGSSFRTFPGRYFSQVPNTGNKDKVIRKFNKKHEVLASSGVEAVVTSTEPVIGDVSSGIKVELSTAPSPAASIGKKVSTVKPKRRPKSKKVEDKSSPAVSVLEESLNAVPKPKGSGNRKSSSAKVL